MIEIQLNGKKIKIDAPTSLQAFLCKQKYEGDSFAIAVNECFVPRSQYQQVQLKSGDRIEVLTAMQGG